METEHFKKKLLAERAEVETQLKGIAARDPKNPSNWQATAGDIDTMPAAADANEAGDRQEEQEVRSEETEGLEGRLNDINAALHNIETGKYGICEVGGEMIEEERLQANPAARTCKAHM